MPKFYTKDKKKKCILLIGGFKDIPHIWTEIEKYFILYNIDYYAPRTIGNGRSFFHVTTKEDWIITYLESIYVLEQMYEQIDIIGFSTGALIALYLTQFKYKCKINNLFLCAPFITHNNNWEIKLLFGDNILSKLLKLIYTYTIRFHPKIIVKYSGYRDTNCPIQSNEDYCEIFGDLLAETELMNLVKFRPKQIIANNVIMLYPNDDDIIGNKYEQIKIIENIYKKKINVHIIPDNEFSPISIKIENKCAHVMFKEKSQIIENIFNVINHYL